MLYSEPTLLFQHSLVGNNGQYGHCVTTMENSTDAGRALQQTRVPNFVRVVTKKPEYVCLQMQMVSTDINVYKHLTKILIFIDIYILLNCDTVLGWFCFQTNCRPSPKFLVRKWNF